MKKHTLLLFLLSILIFTLVACSGDNTTSDTKNNGETGNKLKIYTTVFPLEDFTKKIGGDLVDVESILPSGADAHTYEPTTKTMVSIADSDGFIYSGVGIESFADKIQESLKSEDVAFINAGEGIELLAHSEEEHSEDEHSTDEHSAEEHTTEEHSAEEHSAEEHSEEESHAGHNHGDEDPHVWIDPIRSITIAENIKDALIELKPEEKDTFEANFEKVKTQLEELDQSFTALVNESAKKEILVSHAAYGYWQERYGIEQISVLGLSPTEEPSQKQLQTIIETAKEHDLKYVIFETNVSSKIADIVQSEIQAEALTLSNLETISEEDRENNEDYFSIMERNIETLKKALSE
ncbi:adhesin [Bacillus sp. 7586-K]|uniref:metal ABC transporter substrate-binding protein n=1 Tax=Metabacillus niabensis TaxID=324854 RepID=UPI000BA5CFF4|nr:adhesin [Bacillus sp. 7586-K]